MHNTIATSLQYSSSWFNLIIPTNNLLMSELSTRTSGPEVPPHCTQIKLHRQMSSTFVAATAKPLQQPIFFHFTYWF